ncbi:MAG: N,N-dimethylformamidase beta subunit family domain-containing protein [Chloroflexota bacterium]
MPGFRRQRDGGRRPRPSIFNAVGALLVALLVGGLAGVLVLSARSDTADTRPAAQLTMSATQVPISTPASSIPARPTRSGVQIPPTSQTPATLSLSPTAASPVPVVAATSQLRLGVNRGTISGFLSSDSTADGQRLNVYVTTPAPFFNVEVYRLGWYADGNNQAALIDRLPALPGIVQPAALTDAATGMVAATNWTSNGSLLVRGWPTGLYVLKLVALDGDQSYIPLVVRDDVGRHDFLLEHASTTDQAYNAWGGKSLYSFNSTGQVTDSGTSAAVKVSFDRPYFGSGAGGALDWELNMVRWLEANHFDVGYVSDVDVHRDAQFAARAGAVLVVGHNEYWSREMRDHLEAVRNEGRGVGFFSGDTGAWAIRLEDSPLGSNRVEVGYKDAPDPLAATDPDHSTGHWRDPPLNRPTQAFFGLGTGTNVRRSSDWIVQGAAAVPELFASTGLKDGDSVPNVIGYEYDGQWTPGMLDSPLEGLRVFGVSRVRPVSIPNPLVNVAARRFLPTAEQPTLGALAVQVETVADKPYWQMYVHAIAAGRSIYFEYAPGPSSQAPHRRTTGRDEYLVFAVGDQFSDPGWRPFERNLGDDYQQIFHEPVPDDMRVEAVLIRGTLSIGQITFGSATDSTRLDTVGPDGASQEGWQITEGNGKLGTKLGAPDGKPALTLEVSVPGERRPDDAQSVYIPAGSRGAVIAVGSIDWSWGLDADATFGPHTDPLGTLTPVDSRLQALTRNLLHALVAHA